MDSRSNETPYIIFETLLMRTNIKLDWGDVEMFCQLARFSSFREAARKSEQSVETIRRRISNLELRLGRRLFRRSISGLVITEFGESVLTHALQAKSSIVAISTTAGGERSASRSAFAVAISQEIMPAWYSNEKLSRFLGEEDFTLNLYSDAGAADDFYQSSDISVFLTRPTDGELKCRKLGVLNYHLHCGQALRENEITTLDDFLLSGSDLCAPVYDKELMKVFERFLYEVDLTPSFRYFANSLSAARSLVASTGSIGLFPNVPEPYNRMNFNPLRQFGPALLEREVWIAFHADVVESVAGRTLVDLLSDSVIELFGQNQNLTPHTDAISMSVPA